ncbi:C4-type zinc finger protein, DksA/TraR family [Labilithrix luteola]|uniref:C4-type zinc finger protein, DksA/TraR family n=1 Tax=Labilithrix luteola TaxID=1391654 RepID=A0A0K1PYY1_9BACT|nr:TraR/DksA family transcriptional regulator [Labilithrix luteola]AKU98723.1 C4-type zinc finger protein, DksA/TraR family [Labilithrix luteola]
MHLESQEVLAREIELLAVQFETLTSVITERVCVRDAMGAAESPTPRWLRTLAVLAVDIEFLVSRRNVIDLEAVGDVCREAKRLLAHESEDEGLRGDLRKAFESSALVRAIAGEAELQSRRVSALALLQGGMVPGTGQRSQIGSLAHNGVQDEIPKRHHCGATRMKLTTKDRESFRVALESKRAELLRAHDRNLAAATHLEEESLPDPMDAATRATAEGELLGLARQERGLLAEIDRALAKLDAGTYGVSELSGRPIPIERLRVLPWARLTADEEERRAR